MQKSIVSIVAALLISLSGSFAQEIKVIKYPELEKMINDTKGKELVINFWATWCKPCILEMPYFEQMAEEYKGKNVEVVLVSLDFTENIARVEKFVERKGIKSKVVLLDEIDYNSWIDKVDPSWSGAIPATLMVNSKRGKKQFFEQEFKAQELKKSVDTFIQ